MVECKGKTAQDCWNCGRWYSSHSLHYCRVEKQHVQEVTCSIGGHRVFNEEGERIN